MSGIVLLHGRGASGRDMMGLIPALGAEGFAAAAPDAPGHSWWPTSFLAPSAEMEPWVARGLGRVDGALSGMERGRSVVVGFSQGACLALEWAARRGVGIGAVVAFSGGLVGTADRGGPEEALYGAADKAFDYGADLTGVRVVVTCHERDPHIPLKRARDSADVLGRLGAEVAMVAHPGVGHQPMPDGIAAARAAVEGLGPRI